MCVDGGRACRYTASWVASTDEPANRGQVKWRCGHGREGMEDCFSGAEACEQGHHTRSSVASLPPPQHIVLPCRTAALWNSGMVKEDFRASVLRGDVDGSRVGHRWRHLIILSYEIFNVTMKGRHIPNGRISFFALTKRIFRRQFSLLRSIKLRSDLGELMRSLIRTAICMCSGDIFAFSLSVVCALTRRTLSDTPATIP